MQIGDQFAVNHPKVGSGDHGQVGQDAQAPHEAGEGRQGCAPGYVFVFFYRFVFSRSICRSLGAGIHKPKATGSVSKALSAAIREKKLARKAATAN